eukprot:TRINITY_DN8515_c0_g2_i3.p1 TRINITY_DN8515_c0_g2~~TRINITY_DN8515_c0_g2_i3.p1  ORF type:complete len:244 (+),score=19.26 TRINITY_DN8515_c0_g2_i3:102-734(+)
MFKETDQFLDSQLNKVNITKSTSETDDMSQYQEWLKYRKEFMEWKRNNHNKFQGSNESVPCVLQSERLFTIQVQNQLLQQETNFQNTLESIQQHLRNIKAECINDEGEMIQKKGNKIFDSQRSIQNTQLCSASTTMQKLQIEFEHEAGMFNDDVDFIREVAVGKELAPEMNLAQELFQLKNRFEIWKEHFKYKLRDARDIIATKKIVNKQ